MSNKSIYIINSNENNFDIFKEIFGERYELCSASSGENPNCADLIFVDITSGISALKEIRAKNPLSDTPVIAFSENGGCENRRFAIELGAADFVSLKDDKALILRRAENALRLSSINKLSAENDFLRSQALSEKQIRAVTNDLMQRTVSQIPVGIGIFRQSDKGFIPIFFSERLYSILGSAHNQIVGQKQRIGMYIEKYNLAPNTSDDLVLPYTRPDGKRLWIKILYRTVVEEGALTVYTVISDISKRIEADRQAAVRDRMYQVLIEGSNSIIFSYSPDLDELAYFKSSEDGNSQHFVIPNISKNISELRLLVDEDKYTFVRELKNLTDKEDSKSIVVKMLVEGYPRRFRTTIKSISDSDGVIFRVVGKMEDVDDELTRIEEIQSRAMYDSLCVDIYNKATTEELIRAELERSTTGALLMIDVDDFKSINDRLGHMFGDEFLKMFATNIRNVFRESDIVGRYGGDEFFVFVPHATAALAEKKGRQILKKIAEINIPELGAIKSSIGISVANPENRDYSNLLKKADTALYQAKNHGKNCVVLFDQGSMKVGSYRTKEAAKNRGEGVVLSANPNSAAPLTMRIFSSLYNETDIESGINRALELVGRNFDVSRVYIFEDSEDGKFCSNTFEWCAQGVSPEKKTLQNLSYTEDLGGNYRERMNDDGIFYCRDIKSIEDLSTREILERQGIKSILQCSILDSGKFRGFVGFDECRENRFWTQEQIDSLVFLSKVISVFLIKGRKS